MKNRLDVQKALDANIPTEVVQQRQGSGGKQLDYLPGWYVKKKLSEVFGLHWDFKVVELDSVDSGKTTRRGDQVIEATCIGVLTVRFKDGDDVVEVIREDVGFGNGDKELANKEAVTDCLKRCASSLGNSVGLGLYDPERAGVGKPTLNKRDGDVLFKTVQDTLRLATTADDLVECWKDNTEAIKSLPRDYQPHVREVFHSHLLKLISESLSSSQDIKQLASNWKSNSKYMSEFNEDFTEQITGLKDTLKASLS